MAMQRREYVGVIGVGNTPTLHLLLQRMDCLLSEPELVTDGFSVSGNRCIVIFLRRNELALSPSRSSWMRRPVKFSPAQKARLPMYGSTDKGMKWFLQVYMNRSGSGTHLRRYIAVRETAMQVLISRTGANDLSELTRRIPHAIRAPPEK